MSGNGIHEGAAHSEGSRRSGSVRVLVVAGEDFSEVVGRFEGSSSMVFDVVPSCVHALKRLSEHDYRLVLIDLDLAGRVGYETVRSIRGSNSKVINRSIPLIGIADAKICERDAGDLGLDCCVARAMPSHEMIALFSKYAVSDGPAAEDVEIFDRARLLRRVGGNAAVLEKIMVTFLGSVPEQIAALQDALDDADVARVHLLSHTLKGSCANVEALRIRDSAYRIELAARTGDLAHAAEYMADVRREFARFEQTVASPQGAAE